MRKQLIGVVLLMFGMDYAGMLWNFEGGVAAFGAAQWALLAVTAVMLGLGLYLSLVGWKEFNKVLDEREKEKKQAKEKFNVEAFSDLNGSSSDKKNGKK
ncbi:MAG: hypothetical protein J5744_00320 [Oscillospiraceae bacterium]|nr:hypothetical protein [Oscillospiraceae bacterium]